MEFQEVFCPLCDHRFTALKKGIQYTIGQKTDVLYYETPCPKCGETLFFNKLFPYGLVREFIPEEDIKIKVLSV